MARGGVTAKGSGAPCSKKGYCPAMKQAMGDQNSSTRHPGGISEVVLLNIVKGALWTGGIAFRPPGKGAAGIMLNLCPWCGVKLDWFDRAGEKTKAKKGKVPT